MMKNVLILTTLVFTLAGGSLVHGQIEDVNRLIASIDHQKEINRKLEQKIDENREEIEERKEEFEEAKALEDQLKEIRDRVLEIETTVFAKEDEFRALEKLARVYWETFQPNVSTIEIGHVFPTIESSLGGEYQNAEIVQVFDDGVQIKHPAGFAKLPFQDMPPEMLEGCTLRPETAGAYVMGPDELFELRPRDVLVKGSAAAELLRREKLIREAAYEDRKDAVQAKIEENDEKWKAARAAAEANRKHNQQVEAQIRQIQATITALQKQSYQIFGQKTNAIREYNSQRIKGDRKAHERQVADFDAQVARIQAEIGALNGKIAALRATKK